MIIKTDIKEKFSNLIKEQNLNFFDDPFVVKNFLKNVEDYLNWNTLNEAINNDIVNWRLIEEEDKAFAGGKEHFEVPWNVPFWAGIRQQDKQFILDYVNNGSTFQICGCCILNDNLKSLVSDIQEAFTGACDIRIYGSKNGDTKAFPPHADRPFTFIIQADGDTDWIVFKNRISNMLLHEYYEPKREELIPALEVTLSPGDLLYIPPRAYHCALPSMPRLSMSIPCISFDSFYYLQNYVPDFYQIVNRLATDTNKYEF